MSTKALFITAMGDGLLPFGKVKAFTAAGNVLTTTAHGFETGAGPYKVMNNNLDIPAGLTAAVFASTFMTPSTMIATDVLIVNGKSYTLIATPAADGDVDVGANDALTLTNICAAVNQDILAGATRYHPTTTRNPDVKGIVTSPSQFDIVARTLDAALGNAITVSSPDATMTVDNPTLQGGVSGTDYFVIRLDADTYSLALTKAAAIAGTVVTLTDAGTGMHTLVPTVQTFADAMEDVVNNVLTANGSRSNVSAFLQGKFWRAVIDGVGSDRI